MKKIHGSENIMKCNKCDTELHGIRSLKRHMRHFHGEELCCLVETEKSLSVRHETGEDQLVTVVNDLFKINEDLDNEPLECIINSIPDREFVIKDNDTVNQLFEEEVDNFLKLSLQGLF